MSKEKDRSKADGERKEISIKAKPLTEKLKDSHLKKLIEMFYETETLTHMEGGTLDFSTDLRKKVEKANKLSYNEFLEIQINSLGSLRCGFQKCYYCGCASFAGRLERKTKDKVCFDRIFVNGMYMDGQMFEAREDHVWMEEKGFEEFRPGDKLRFYAEVYPYIKCGNGKRLDFALRNPEMIEKVNDYHLPTDNELYEQFLRELRCETCLYSDHCDGVYCVFND